MNEHVQTAAFTAGMIKAATMYPGTILHPDGVKWRRIAVATGAGGAALGVGGTLALLALSRKVRDRKRKPARA